MKKVITFTLLLSLGAVVSCGKDKKQSSSKSIDVTLYHSTTKKKLGLKSESIADVSELTDSSKKEAKTTKINLSNFTLMDSQQAINEIEQLIRERNTHALIKPGYTVLRRQYLTQIEMITMDAKDHSKETEINVCSFVQETENIVLKAEKGNFRELEIAENVKKIVHDKSITCNGKVGDIITQIRVENIVPFSLEDFDDLRRSLDKSMSFYKVDKNSYLVHQKKAKLDEFGIDEMLGFISISPTGEPHTDALMFGAGKVVDIASNIALPARDLRELDIDGKTFQTQKQVDCITKTNYSPERYPEGTICYDDASSSETIDLKNYL
ncbi:MAG: hypothetical protein KDD40_01495 [Bdellovibrionales bacterium]|nr:hypothetical protein [Bdellovibrionales bacterium]